jgi:hypothetical protein
MFLLAEISASEDTMPNHNKAFRNILKKVAGHNAATLEARARQANWLAHKEFKHAKRLYAIKHLAVSQLFKISGFEPILQGCANTPYGLTLSIGLRTWGQLHVPLNRLTPQARKYVLEPRTRNCQSRAK